MLSPLILSGLDSFAALVVMGHLQRLAQSAQQTVIATIHQPRSDIWDMFDKVGSTGRGEDMRDDAASRHAYNTACMHTICGHPALNEKSRVPPPNSQLSAPCCVPLMCVPQVSLLSAGRLMFHGACADLLPWFTSLGYVHTRGERLELGRIIQLCQC